MAAGQTAVYGVNTGFGHLCRKRIEPAALAQLQHNLILSHAVGVGPPVPDPLVRLMLLLKVHALAHGFSGVSESAVRGLLALINHDILPHVPRQGSLGASGDLAPLAHLVLPLIGYGTVRRDDRETDAATVLGRAPDRTDRPRAQGRIGFNQRHAVHGRLRRGTRAPRPASTQARRHRGSHRARRSARQPGTLRRTAARATPAPRRDRHRVHVRRLMTGSKILESHANCEKVQDPYSLRCVPQVHGATRQAVEHAAAVVETEINAVTDNPIVFEDGTTISGGLFHGQPLAVALDYLAIAVAELASISERRTYLLLSGHDGLPELLMRETGLNSGFMLPQYTAAALVSENKGLCTPASVDSIPTSLGQEDHVSMGATAATKAWRVMDNAETVLAIEEMCAAQALDYRAPIEPGRGVKIAHQVIRKHIEHAEADRLFAYDINVSLDTLRDRQVVRAVEAELGELQ
jgi:histidine ammonia-lyase